MTALSPEISVLALSVGLVLALICYLCTNLSPGGMISPGWIALVMIANPRLAAVMAGVVIVTYLISRGLTRIMILYGKRLFATVVLVAVFLQITTFLFVVHTLPQDFQLTTLGFIVPGLIAYQLIRQPILPTLVSTTTIAAASYAIVLVGVDLNLIETQRAGVAAQRLDAPTLHPTTTVFVLIVLAVAVGAGLLTYLFRRVSQEGPERETTA